MLDISRGLHDARSYPHLYLLLKDPLQGSLYFYWRWCYRISFSVQLCNYEVKRGYHKICQQKPKANDNDVHVSAPPPAFLFATASFLSLYDVMSLFYSQTIIYPGKATAGKFPVSHPGSN